MYKFLGAISIANLVFSLGLSAYVILGTLKRKQVYFYSGLVLALMIAESMLCWWIYREFG